MARDSEAPGSGGIEDLRQSAVRRISSVRKRPTPKRVHKTRVQLRRLRTALRDDERPRARKLRKAAKGAFRALGPVREADVLLGLLTDHGVDGDAPLRARIREERRRGWKRARKPLKRLQERLGRSRTKTMLAGSNAVEPSAPSVGMGEVLNAVLAFDPGLRTATDPNQFHDARIAVKRLRYTIQQVVRDDAEPDGVLTALSRLQVALGALHDQDLLVAALAVEVNGDSQQYGPGADLRHALGKARRRRATLHKQAVAAWSSTLDGGLRDQIAALS